MMSEIASVVCCSVELGSRLFLIISFPVDDARGQIYLGYMSLFLRKKKIATVTSSKMAIHCFQRISNIKVAQLLNLFYRA